MALKSAGLVDIQFLVSYLARYIQIPALADSQEEENHLVELLKAKLEKEDVAQKWVDNLAQTQHCFDIAKKFGIEKLDELLI